MKNEGLTPAQVVARATETTANLPRATSEGRKHSSPVTPLWVKDFLEALQEFLKLTGYTLTPLGVRLLFWCGVISFACVAIWAVLNFVNQIRKVWREIRPYDEAEAKHVARRRQFASHIEAEIRRLNSQEDWSDHRFAELEAEVEAEGRRRKRSLLGRRRLGVRREKSLSTALANSEDRLILLEGEPGAGKSVALRYLASKLAQEAMKSRDVKSLIPLYVNLKTIERPKDAAVDVALIKAHVVKMLNRPNDRDIAQFITDEFERGLREGTWLFLFDSFDEIPEVLSSTSADTIIRSYADAIADFLHGFNTCRGIIASRHFRGPGELEWPRFRILALSDERRKMLIRRADLPVEIERDLIGSVDVLNVELASLSRNPMYLGLLCEYAYSHHRFPPNAHVVFEDHVERRLKRDAALVKQRFAVDAESVRFAAETAAFCMSEKEGLGLSPPRGALVQSMKEAGFTNAPEVHLDALEFIKLGRAETGELGPAFTFSHRRFQEYFATHVVLQHPDRVSAHTLLTDARWRETAVVMLQTHDASKIRSLLAEAERLVREQQVQLAPLIEALRADQQTPRETEDEDTAQVPVRKPVEWPPLTLHLAGLLQAGFVQSSTMPPSIQEPLGEILLAASTSGVLMDRKWALEVAGGVHERVLATLLRDAFKSPSHTMVDVAYRQVARLSSVPDDIAASIRRAMVMLFATRRLKRERDATRAHVSRLNPAKEFLRALSLLEAAPRIDTIIHLAVLALLYAYEQTNAQSYIPLGAFFVLFLYNVVTRPWLAYWVATPAFMVGPSLIVTYLRFGLYVVVVGLSSHKDGTLWILVAYAALWSPGAFAAVRTGIGLASYAWPLLPIWPLMWTVRHGRSMMVSLREVWKFAVILVASLAGAVWFVIYLATLIAPWIQYVSLTIAAIASITAIAHFLPDRIRDLLVLRRIKRAAVIILTVPQIIETMQRFRTLGAKARYLRYVREVVEIEVTSDSVRQILEASVAIEDAVATRRTARELGGIMAGSEQSDVLDATIELTDHLRNTASRQSQPHVS